MSNLNVILTTAQLNKLNTRRSFQLSHTQLNRGGRGVHEIQLRLTPKAARKANTAIRKGKGLRINPNDDVDSDEIFGDGIKLRKIGRIAKKVGKIATPILAPAIIAGATYATGNPAAGVIANEVIQRGVAGAGFGSIARKGAKLTKQYVPKSVVKAGQQALVNQIAAQTGSTLAGDLANSALSAGVNNVYSGSGFGSIARKGAKLTKQYVPKSVVNAGKQALVNQIVAQTGSNLAGNIANSALSSGVKEVYGSGMVVMNPNALPHAVNPSAKYGIRLKGSQSAMDHMAMVRAARKINGGSFR